MNKTTIYVMLFVLVCILLFALKIISNYKEKHKNKYPLGKDYIPITACVIPVDDFHKNNYIMYNGQVRLVINYMNVNTYKTRILSELEFLSIDTGSPDKNYKNYFYRYVNLYGYKYRFEIPYEISQGKPKLISIVEVKNKRRKYL